LILPAVFFCDLCSIPARFEPASCGILVLGEQRLQFEFKNDHDIITYHDEITPMFGFHLDPSDGYVLCFAYHIDEMITELLVVGYAKGDGCNGESFAFFMPLLLINSITLFSSNRPTRNVPTAGK